MSERKIYSIAISLALLIAGSAFAYKHFSQVTPTFTKELPVVGKVGSDHAHASLLIMTRDRILSFCSPQYMLKSQYVHFEDNDCTVVHRHATGVTIPTFLKTIGITIANDCLIIPGDKTYCDSGKDRLKIVINGDEVPLSLLPYYVFRNNDHVLINYGPETGTELRFKYNQVPQVPIDVNEPINIMPFGKVLEEKPLENVK